MADSLVENYPMTLVHRRGPNVIESAGAPERALSARRGAESTRRDPARAGRATSPERGVVSEHQSGFTPFFPLVEREMTGQSGSQGEAPEWASRQSLVRGDFAQTPARVSASRNVVQETRMFINLRFTRLCFESMRYSKHLAAQRAGELTVGEHIILFTTVVSLCANRNVAPQQKGRYLKNLRRARRRLEEEARQMVIADVPVVVDTGPVQSNSTKSNQNLRSLRHLKRIHYKQRRENKLREFGYELQDAMQHVDAQVKQEGYGQACHVCGLAIHGLVYHDLSFREVHVGCAQAPCAHSKSTLAEATTVVQASPVASGLVRAQASRSFNQRPRVAPADMAAPRKSQDSSCGRRHFRDQSVKTKAAVKGRSSAPWRGLPHHAFAKEHAEAEMTAAFIYDSAYEVKHLGWKSAQTCHSSRPALRRTDLCLQDVRCSFRGYQNKCVQNAILDFALNRQQRQKWSRTIAHICNNHEPTGRTGSLESRDNWMKTEQFLLDRKLCLKVVEASSMHAWQNNGIVAVRCLGVSQGRCLGTVLACKSEAHLWRLTLEGNIFRGGVENALDFSGKALRTPMGGKGSKTKESEQEAIENTATREINPTLLHCAPSWLTNRVWYPRPLWNADNRCYMNAILQSLWSCNIFRLECLNACRFQESSSSINPGQTIMQRPIGELAHAGNSRWNSLPNLHRLLLDAYHGQARYTTYSYRVGGLAHELHQGAQEDAQEFLARCLNCPGSDESRLTDLWRGQESRSFRCSADGCNHSQTALTFSPCEDVSPNAGQFDMRILQLDMHNQGTTPTVQAAIELYQTEKRLCDTETRFQCVHCGSRDLPFEKTVITWWPKILFVHFKLFQFDVKSQRSRKISNKIHLDEELILGEAAYDLKAVIYHGGENAGEGHYWSYVRASSLEWILCNDEQIRPAAPGEPFQSFVRYDKKAIYLLVYEQRHFCQSLPLLSSVAPKQADTSSNPDSLSSRPYHCLRRTSEALARTDASQPPKTADLDSTANGMTRPKESTQQKRDISSSGVSIPKGEVDSMYSGPDAAMVSSAKHPVRVLKSHRRNARLCLDPGDVPVLMNMYHAARSWAWSAYEDDGGQVAQCPSQRMPYSDAPACIRQFLRCHCPEGNAQVNRITEGRCFESLCTRFRDMHQDAISESSNSAVEDFCLQLLAEYRCEIKSDEERLKELELGGYKCIELNGLSNKDSLADTLAVALLGAGDVANDEDSKIARAKMCRKARAYVNNTKTCQFPTRLLHADGTLVMATDQEHSEAAYSRSTHGDVLLRYWVHKLQKLTDRFMGGVRLRIYTRLDCDSFVPEKHDVLVGGEVASDMPPLQIQLFQHLDDNLCDGGYSILQPVRRRKRTKAGNTIHKHATLVSCAAQDDASSEDEGKDGLENHRLELVDSSMETSTCQNKEALDATAAARSSEALQPTTREDINTDAIEESARYHLHIREQSPDPRRRLETSLERLAQRLRSLPTIPEMEAQDYKRMFLEDEAVRLPAKHCAFKGCCFSAEDNEALSAHLWEAHAHDLEEPANLLTSSMYGSDVKGDSLARMSVYQEAIAMVCRGNAPLACNAIDRRSLREYDKLFEFDNAESLVCWCCARKYPYVKGQKHNLIEWVRPLAQQEHSGHVLFHGRPLHQAQRLFDTRSYLEKYAPKGMPSDEIQDWQLQVGTSLELWQMLCCPEDHFCQHATCMESRRLCIECWLPECHECSTEMRLKTTDLQMPAPALANDLMIFYAPEVIYEKQVTTLELLCASTCLTTMICFSLEKKYRGENAFDSKMHMNNHRMGARGNATSFPLPWQDLLAQLSEERPALPRSGQELSQFVSVLLKTSEEEVDATALSRFVHQALVRRDVVVELITAMKATGHPAYAHVDLDVMEAKACRELPEHGVPPEIAKLLPYDALLDNIQVQKQATPVAARQPLEELAEAFKYLKPNGVVLEKSGSDEGDINAQRIAAIQHLKEELEKGEVREPAEQVCTHAASPQAWPQTAPGLKESALGKSSNARCKEINGQRDDPVEQEIEGGRKVERLAVITGNQLIDQFQPWYFGIAFAFLFKYCIGMPDMPQWSRKPRYRRNTDAPRIETNRWVQVMSRRVEAQISRDWHFGFVSWNYLFRTAINLSRTVIAYEKASASEENPKTVTAADLQDAAIAIAKALNGSYTDPNGKVLQVNGDMTKVRYSKEVAQNPVAKKLLMNIEHTTRKIPGTQETRKLMRYDTNAHRQRYGLPIFVTFSPDEAHNLLMIRFSRTRTKDPVNLSPDEDDCHVFGLRNQPCVNQNEEQLSWALDMRNLAKYIPNWKERRRILARDSLASVEGFRNVVLSTCRHLFGMRVCPKCPDCNRGGGLIPCQDLFGSNAEPEGGIFGRMDAAYISFEAQKSTGSLHAHCQLFLQCLHQLNPIHDIAKKIKSLGKHVVLDYLAYKAHVCRQTYPQIGAELEDNLWQIEKKWPEYQDSAFLISRPDYLRKSEDVLTSREYANAYLLEDVQRLQQMKQHHVHVYNDETQAREPLQACRRKDKPWLCKSDFPRDLWLIDKRLCCVLAWRRKWKCLALAEKTKLAVFMAL